MSIKVGDKFIIEIGTIAELPDGKKKYFIKPFESLVFDKIGLAQLEPVEKAWENELEKAKEFAYKDGFENGKLWAIDENAKDRQEYYDKGYDKGLIDASLTAWTLLTSKNTGEIFTEYGTVSDILGNVPMKEIRDRVKAYEEKVETEIKVGDEVITLGKNIAVVTRVEDNCVRVMFKDGSGFREQHTINELKKTGRHFDEVEQLLDKLRGTKIG